MHPKSLSNTMYTYFNVKAITLMGDTKAFSYYPRVEILCSIRLLEKDRLVL